MSRSTKSDGSLRRPVKRAEAPGRSEQLFVARAELALALPDHLSLRELPLKPDPLEALAAAVADVRKTLSERVDLVLDLVPVPAGKVSRKRNQLLSAARRRPQDFPSIPGMPQGSGSGFSLDRLASIGSEIAAEMRGPQARGAQGRGAQGQRRSVQDMKVAMGKFVPGVDPVLDLQMLLRACSTDPTRPRMLLDQVLAALEGWSGDNHLQPVGLNLGITRVRADSALYRRHFDLRFESGAFAPRQHGWVTGQEIAGLLKPPTKHNTAANVARSGGVVPPPPPNLPVWNGQPGLLPLGWVAKPGGGERLAGIPLKYLLFALFLGKAGYGKTEMSLVQAIALAHNGHGILFLDPHGDGWQRARPYLAHRKLAPRMWEIDLTSPDLDAMAASWNPLSMQNRRVDDIPDIVQYIVTGFSSALNWSDSAGRAKTILTRSVESLVELSRLLNLAGRADIAPTIFQIRTILADEVWRDTVVPYLSKNLRDFWTKTYPKYSNEATPVVTNIIERLDSSNALKAFLGSSLSTYDIRTAMDEGKIVFVCPSGTGDTDRIVSCLLIYDLFRAGLSRRDMPVADRKDFYTYIDELTAVDGASKGTLAAIAEQLRKFKVKMLAMTQMAQRLTPTTRQGLLQNLSVLSSTASDVDEALLVTRRWGKKVDPDTITQLKPYHYVMSVTLNDGRTDPFKVRGASVEDLYADYYRPDDLPKLTQSVNQNLKRRPVRDILADLRRLDSRIRVELVKLPIPPDDEDDDGQSAGVPSGAGPGGGPGGQAPGTGPVRIHKDPGTVVSGLADDAGDDTAAAGGQPTQGSRFA
ncbi:ATP/GTP-binding protein [Kitasatospora sp. NBC_00240]|uniref:ATP/GTP-binding protein n=1 Tax=Kitasatospora sp. NBC_00240 TaxID=2903567 RepID=UPI002253F8B0|nr:ATP/GTP-binding protein [Kitasatospora sp. NBC_00240]MCX5216201.1 ATP/GTP-binding protein [Kitasatospora sp. NBC_00240]